ncbi:hypothetical protein [Nocardioides sp. R-C-SC26]|uniref:hypothetical protein n=1 Tax=Nocardioides sp. R-C-SC26 TaxID=2870414 RepID=UPI001E427AE4|nr:hypothetical protein [Nocardioides sp. R-C-SC26]
MRRTAWITSLVVIAALTPLVLASPGQAATAYTWSGASSSTWSDARNWTPSGIPADGDSVTVGPVPSGAHQTVDGVPTVRLASLTMIGNPARASSLSGTGQVTTGELRWTGGDINLDLVVAPTTSSTPSLISPTQTTLGFGRGGDQTLTLAGPVELTSGAAAGDRPWLTFWFDSGMRIAEGGTLEVDPTARLLGSRCCSGTASTVVVDGALRVRSAGTTVPCASPAKLEQLGLDLAGAIDVARGGELQVVGGPIRVGGNAVNSTSGPATLTGGGRLTIAETDGDNFRPESPLAPDHTMKFLGLGERLTLADRSTLALGDDAVVSGVGTIAGSGQVRFAGPDIRGELTLASGVSAMTERQTITRITVRDPAVRGQSGALIPGGGLAMTGNQPGSQLWVMSGARLTIPAGARLTVPDGATVAAGGCCTSLGVLTLQEGSQMLVGDRSSADAVVKWVEVDGQGRLQFRGRTVWDVPTTRFTSAARIIGTGRLTGDLNAGNARVQPNGVFTIDGDYTAAAGGLYIPAVSTAADAPGRLVVTGTARLAGRMQTTRSGEQAPSGAVRVLRAAQVVGSFRCSIDPGRVMSTTSTGVTTKPLPVSTDGCVAPTSRRVLSASIDGTRSVKIAAPAGATSVLAAVTVSRAIRATTVTLDGGTSSRGSISAPRGRTVKRTVLVGLGSRRMLAVRSPHRATVSITLLGFVVTD